MVKTMLNNIKIKDSLVNNHPLPTVNKKAYFREALEVLEISKLGVVCILNNDNHLEGILTDGDIRRVFIKNQDPMSRLFLKNVSELMIENPFCLDPEEILVDGLKEMNDRKIWVCPVVDVKGLLHGIFHMQWALKHLLQEKS